MKPSVSGVAFVLTAVLTAIVGVSALAAFAAPFGIAGVLLAKALGIRPPRRTSDGNKKEKSSSSSAKEEEISPLTTTSTPHFDVDRYFSHTVVAFLFRLHDVIADTFLAAWYTFIGWCLERYYGMQLRTLVELGAVNTLAEGDDGGSGNHDFGYTERDSPFVTSKKSSSSSSSSSAARRKYLISASDWAQHVMPPPPPGKVTIIMCNHRTRIDWMVLWIFLARSYGWIIGLRIALKSPLRKVPVVGWAMQHARFLFLERDRNKDEEVISTVAKYYAVSTKGCNDGIFGWRKWLPGGPVEKGGGTVLLIFPEGTDLSVNNIAKSQKWAQANGKPLYRQVLNPRTTGLLHLRRALGDAQIAGIIDITMGYCDHTVGTITTEKCIFEGTMPREVHVLLRQYASLDAAVKAWVPTASSPPSDEQFTQFVESSFAQKEIDLAAFYRSFPEEFQHVINPLQSIMGADTPRGGAKPGGNTTLDADREQLLGKKESSAAAGSNLARPTFPSGSRVYAGNATCFSPVGQWASPIIWAIIFSIGHYMWYRIGAFIVSIAPWCPFPLACALTPTCYFVAYIVMTKVYGGYDGWFFRFNQRRQV